MCICRMVVSEAVDRFHSIYQVSQTIGVHTHAERTNARSSTFTREETIMWLGRRRTIAQLRSLSFFYISLYIYFQLFHFTLHTQLT